MDHKLNDLPELKEFTKLLKAAGSKISGAEFLAYKRKEQGKSDINNRQILDWLLEQGRDLLSLNAADEKQIEKVFVAEANRRMDRLSTRNPVSFAKALDGVLVGALRKALLEIIKIVRERIETQKDASRQAIKPLTEEYRKQKIEKFGKAEPVAVATGQLLDNVQDRDSNIRILRK